MRSSIERVVIGAFSALAILVPLVMGLIGYLAFSDGIAWGEGVPTREGRLWMEKQPRNFGIALQLPVADAAIDADATVQCVRTRFIFLKLRPRLELESSAEYCRCYMLRDGAWVTTDTACRSGIKSAVVG